MIGGIHWPENPALTVPRWAFAVVDLWMRCRAAGNAMIGGAVLPGAGGMTDQPAALIDAFDMLDAAMKQEQADAGDSAG